MRLPNVVHKKRVEPQSDICFLDSSCNGRLGCIEGVIIYISDDSDMKILVVAFVGVCIEQIYLGRQDLLHAVHEHVKCVGTCSRVHERYGVSCL